MSDFTSITGLVGRLPTTLEAETAHGEIDKNGFLQLMMAQLNQQDPLEPMDSSQFTSQLAEYTSLEELQNLNATNEAALETNILLAQSINNTMSSTLVGKDIKALSDIVNYDDGEVSTLLVDVPTGVESLEVTVRDSTGSIVRTMSIASPPNGEYEIEWDGKNMQGNNVAEGVYTVEVDQMVGGSASSLYSYVIGNVEAVRYGSEGAVLVVDGLSISFGNVLEVREPDGSDDSGGLLSMIGLGSSNGG